ncbi:MAG: hypothetical protein ACHQNA_01980 [Acidimicrobiales bacterium]
MTPGYHLMATLVETAAGVEAAVTALIQGTIGALTEFDATLPDDIRSDDLAYAAAVEASGLDQLLRTLDRMTDLLTIVCGDPAPSG